LGDKVEETYDKEFEINFAFLSGAAKRFHTRSGQDYLVTREGNLFRIYVKRKEPLHP
jgi:hypothetical protein